MAISILSILNFVLLIQSICIHAEKLPTDSTVLQLDSNLTTGLCQGYDDCEIRCIDGGNSPSSYIDSMNLAYQLREECGLLGATLIVPRDYFTNKTIVMGWLPLYVIIVSLDVDLEKIRNLWPEEILPKWTFSGFKSLKTLIFVDAQLAVGWWSSINISYGLLESVMATLNSMTLIERSDEFTKSFLIQRMLGDLSEPLSNLEYVNVKYNLTVINAKSLTAIPYIRVLDLSECSIAVIEENSFDDLGTLLILRLERNLLVTLPDGIFKELNLSPTIVDESIRNLEKDLTIDLGENPWHCGCKLEATKALLNEYSNFHGDLLCKSPREIENYPIKESEFCPYPITTTRTTSVTTTSTTETYSKTFIEKECHSFGIAENRKVFLQSPMQQIKSSATAEGDVLVTLDIVSEDLALIWFGSDQLSKNSLTYEHSSNIDCVSSLRQEIVINSSDDSARVYTFCLLNMSKATVSPFDCISHNHGSRETELIKIWFTENSKPKVIGIVSACLFAILIVGMVTVVIVHGCIKYGTAIPITSTNSKLVDEMPNQWELNEGQPNASTQSTCTPPPLPPHKPREAIDCDIYYEIVK